MPGFTPRLICAGKEWSVGGNCPSLGGVPAIFGLAVEPSSIIAAPAAAQESVTLAMRPPMNYDAAMLAEPNNNPPAAELQAKPGKPAVFLDRDGTIVEDRGYLRKESDVVFFAQTVPALRQLQERFRLFIVTNQTGVGRGELTLDEANRVNHHVVEWLRERGVNIVAVYCCPHQRAAGCHCAKPNPFFLHQAAQAHGVSLRDSFVIGDHPHDVEFARNGGATGIYVLSGHGEKHRAELRGDALVTPDIGAAAAWILQHSASSGSSNNSSSESSCLP